MPQNLPAVKYASPIKNKLNIGNFKLYHLSISKTNLPNVFPFGILV